MTDKLSQMARKRSSSRKIPGGFLRLRPEAVELVREANKILGGGEMGEFVSDCIMKHGEEVMLEALAVRSAPERFSKRFMDLRETIRRWNQAHQHVSGATTSVFTKAP